MRQFSKLLFLMLPLCVFSQEKIHKNLKENTIPQSFQIIWDKAIGANKSSDLYLTIQTLDGGFLLCGNSDSDISNDKSESNIGDSDYWIVKINSNGVKVWDKTLGGSQGEYITTAIETVDGGYLLGGISFSGISGQKTGIKRGLTDFWFVKIDSNGQFQWDKTIGGNGNEGRPTIIKTNDGGFLVGGTSDSNISWDKTENSKGGSDYWILKYDANFVKQWDKTIGGSGDETLRDIITGAEEGFILQGDSDSNISNDKTENSKGSYDFWLVKIHENGNIQWDKTYGGNSTDNGMKVLKLIEGGYVLGGVSYSPISGDKTTSNKGENDYWILKIDDSGNKLWDKTYGGSDQDVFQAFSRTSDNGFLLFGNSLSRVSGDKSEPRIGSLGHDFWIVKLNSSGDISWDKTIGGTTGSDFASTSINNIIGDYFLLGGTSGSIVSGNKTAPPKGYNDYWVIKLTISNVCQFNETTKSGNWNDPMVWSCGTIPNETQNIIIKTGHNITLNGSMGIQKCKNLTVELGAVFNNNGNYFLAKP